MKGMIIPKDWSTLKKLLALKAAQKAKGTS